MKRFLKAFCLSRIICQVASFAVPIGYVWSPSHIDRNKAQHALEGNGGTGKGNPGRSRTGKGKGKGKMAWQEPVSQEIIEQPVEPAPGESTERLFEQEILASLPPHLKQLGQAQLLQEEWSVRVVPSHELNARGGVALVKKQDVPQVLRQIGQTTRATAIVTTQPAHELFLKGASCAEIWCTIRVPSEGTGTTTAYVKRHLIQLGMDMANQVTMQTAGLTVVQQTKTMQKVVIRFDVQGGWDLATMSGIIVSDMLKAVIPEASFDQLTIRNDGSATALVQKSCMEKLLKFSGTSHVYVKPHVGEVAWEDLEVLWLPTSITHVEALQLVKEYTESLGLARKQGNEAVRFGLRFQGIESLKKAADKIGLGHSADLGRFKITAVMTGTGASDIHDMMSSISWSIDTVEFVGEGHAIVASKESPKHNRLSLQRADGLFVPMYIHAINAKARSLFKQSNLSSRRVDGEGEEHEDAAMPAVPPVSLEQKFQAAAQETQARQTEQKAMKSARDASRTPKRPPVGAPVVPQPAEGNASHQNQN